MKNALPAITPISSMLNENGSLTKNGRSEWAGKGGHCLVSDTILAFI
jgi:hypothetical protein